MSPRRLLPKPDKMSSTGKSKPSIVDYNNSLPTYPALMSCDVPVDTIIPDLISSPMYVTDHTLTTPNYFLTTPTTGQEVLVHYSMLGRSEQWGNWRLFQRIRLLGCIVSGSCDVSVLQVRSLPIQQPKLQTLRNTLESFAKQLEQVSLTMRQCGM